MLAPADTLALCDNPGLLQLDTVWCPPPALRMPLLSIRSARKQGRLIAWMHHGAVSKLDLCPGCGTKVSSPLYTTVHHVLT